MSETKDNSPKSNSFLNIKSNFILRKIFGNLDEIKFLNIIRYNKIHQNKLNISLNNYIEGRKIKIDIIPEKNKFGKFINITDKFPKNNYHIFFNNKQEEIKEKYEITENDKVDKIEAKNAELKNNYGYDKATSYGIGGMTIQGATTLFLVNMKRIFKLEDEKTRK